MISLYINKDMEEVREWPHVHLEEQPHGDTVTEEALNGDQVWNVRGTGMKSPQVDQSERRKLHISAFLHLLVLLFFLLHSLSGFINNYWQQQTYLPNNLSGNTTFPFQILLAKVGRWLSLAYLKSTTHLEIMGDQRCQFSVWPCWGHAPTTPMARGRDSAFPNCEISEQKQVGPQQKTKWLFLKLKGMKTSQDQTTNIDLLLLEF